MGGERLWKARRLKVWSTSVSGQRSRPSRVALRGRARPEADGRLSMSEGAEADLRCSSAEPPGSARCGLRLTVSLLARRR